MSYYRYTIFTTPWLTKKLRYGFRLDISIAHRCLMFYWWTPQYIYTVSTQGFACKNKVADNYTKLVKSYCKTTITAP